MLVVLKIPIVYLAVVVWWAIRAEPLPGGGGEPATVRAPRPPCGWDDWRRRFVSSRRGLRPRRPLGGPRSAGRARPAPVATLRP